MIYAITGGIGAGKSFYCKKLEAEGHAIFYCDDEAKKIIRTNPDVREQLTALVGDGLYDEAGVLQKKVLAAYICRGDAYAQRVNAVVHPRVAEAFKAWAAEQLLHRADVYMECALLFETGFETLVDEVILVTASTETRIQRVMQRDGVSREQALHWIALQMPEDEKAKRAHHIINNE
ncbi:MAG: dephospho-CoA kinase [Bacteroidaceae bacterium]|nr:dephospho-CoA kinase [Bacteroidaceae bacterium]